MKLPEIFRATCTARVPYRVMQMEPKVPNLMYWLQNEFKDCISYVAWGPDEDGHLSKFWGLINVHSASVAQVL